MQAIENTYKIKYCGISGGFGMIYAIGIWQSFDAMVAAFMKDLSHADLGIIMVEKYICWAIGMTANYLPLGIRLTTSLWNIFDKYQFLKKSWPFN
jgi:hypothetical protein